jgi:hypothetical protein
MKQISTQVEQHHATTVKLQTDSRRLFFLARRCLMSSIAGVDILKKVQQQLITTTAPELQFEASTHSTFPILTCQYCSLCGFAGAKLQNICWITIYIKVKILQPFAVLKAHVQTKKYLYETNHRVFSS